MKGGIGQLMKQAQHVRRLPGTGSYLQCAVAVILNGLHLRNSVWLCLYDGDGRVGCRDGACDDDLSASGAVR